MPSLIALKRRSTCETPPCHKTGELIHKTKKGSVHNKIHCNNKTHCITTASLSNQIVIL